MLRINDQVGPYTLIKQLGKGAFGVVWLAENRTSIATSQVAIKISLEEPDLQAIRQEAGLWAQIGGHPNVLPMIEANIYDGQVVIVSEYAPDGSLENWIKKHGGAAPSIKTAIEMMTGILSGLEHLHSKSILHRDLKPANVLLQGETPRLADFGLSRMLKSTSQSTNASGTPAYMSPEAFDGRKIIPSDLWAAGVIFYQLLTGKLPFPTKDYAGLIGAIFQKEPEPLPNFLNKFKPIITKALEKNSENRYQTASHMKAALQTGLNQLEVSNLLGVAMVDTQEVTQKPNSQDLILKSSNYSFETITLDHFGRTINSSTYAAKCFVEEISKGIFLEMIGIPEGDFLIGAPIDEVGYFKNESPQRRINLSEFYISKYVITQSQWKAIMRSNPSFSQGSTLPIENVSWEDANEFCRNLSKKAGKKYRLPSESEWEYAARAGTTTAFAFGETITPAIVNYNSEYPYASAERKESRNKIMAVGSLGIPNAFGLYDMHGNVWEWCLDCYQNDYQYIPIDGNAWQTKEPTAKVLRGGSWQDMASLCRSAFRNWALPTTAESNIGFRVVLSK